MDNWYYLKNQKSTGPLSESKFIELLDQGVIQAQTLVWNPSLPYNWAKFSSLPEYSFLQKQVPEFRDPIVPETLADQKSDQALLPCDECTRLFNRAELIPFNHLFVCANCKPVFLQKLKEGVYKEESMPVVAEMRYAGFWIRFAAYIIDSIILYIANIPIGFLSPFMIERWKTSPSYFFLIQGNIMLFGLIISAVYEILLIGKYGATVGKMVFHLRVVTADRKQVTYLRSLGRYFAKYLSGLICGIGYIMAAFDNEKRGLHDQICNTRVIKK